MKKVLCVLAAVAMVAVFSTSCNKKCTCKTYEAGQVIATVTVDNPNTNVKCSTYSATADYGQGKEGVECK